ncbi:ribbon-helix-helix domain-containing protein [Zavarzinia sp. CC-PAN008]|uniref:ribbon-helix-helix domain-containing protein n=1 Tax=Zavarzinia sp. CC-PAN008 TaxID=3243332 RepID=UPI003F74382B
MPAHALAHAMALEDEVQDVVALPAATPAPMRGSSSRKRSITVAGHRTSISLEDAFWDALVEAARAERVSIAALVARIDEGRGGNLSSAIRVWLLYRAQGAA